MEDMPTARLDARLRAKFTSVADATQLIEASVNKFQRLCILPVLVSLGALKSDPDQFFLANWVQAGEALLLTEHTLANVPAPKHFTARQKLSRLCLVLLCCLLHSSGHLLG